MGVVVRRYIDFLILLIPTPLVLALFCSNLCTFLNVFSFLLLFFVQYSKHTLLKEHPRSFKTRDHADMAI